MTNCKLERICTDIQQSNRTPETDGAIWESTRQQLIKQKIQDFLYKSFHSTHKIGKYWFNIKNLSKRGCCTICNENKTLEHILTKCEANTGTKIWSAAQDIWPHKERLWPPITIGTILGIGLLEVKTTPNPTNQEQENPLDEPIVNAGATRLAKILISEAAYLIWTLQCRRVINDRSYSTEVIESTWRKTVNK